jgi:hypothetical protein
LKTFPSQKINDKKSPKIYAKKKEKHTDDPSKQRKRAGALEAEEEIRSAKEERTRVTRRTLAVTQYVGGKRGDGGG